MNLIRRSIVLLLALSLLLSVCGFMPACAENTSMAQDQGDAGAEKIVFDLSCLPGRYYVDSHYNVSDLPLKVTVYYADPGREPQTLSAADLVSGGGVRVLDASGNVIRDESSWFYFGSEGTYVLEFVYDGHTARSQVGAVQRPSFSVDDSAVDLDLPQYEEPGSPRDAGFVVTMTDFDGAATDVTDKCGYTFDGDINKIGKKVRYVITGKDGVSGTDYGSVYKGSFTVVPNVTDVRGAASQKNISTDTGGQSKVYQFRAGMSSAMRLSISSYYSTQFVEISAGPEFDDILHSSVGGFVYVSDGLETGDILYVRVTNLAQDGQASLGSVQVIANMECDHPAADVSLIHAASGALTCQTEGWYCDIYQCARCGLYSMDPDFTLTYGDAVLSANYGRGSHGFFHEDALPASDCAHTGTIGHFTCSFCGRYFTQPDGSAVISDISDGIYGPHSLDRVAAEGSTCTENGIIEHYACSVCDSTFADADGAFVLTDVSAPLAPHSPVRTEAIDPTCETDGSIARYVCENCGRSFADAECSRSLTDAEVIVPAGHDWDEWAIVTEATCTSPGVASRSCRRDSSHYEESDIPRLAHSDADDNGMCDSCGIDMGIVAKRRCMWCAGVHTGALGSLKGFAHRILLFFASRFGGKVASECVTAGFSAADPPTKLKGCIDADNVFKSAYWHYIIALPENCDTVFVPVNKEHDQVLAFLRADHSLNVDKPAYGFAAGEDGRRVVPSGYCQYFSVPSDAKYLYVYAGRAVTDENGKLIESESYLNRPYEVYFLRSVGNGSSSNMLHQSGVNANVRDVPKNQGIANAQKKISQIFSLEYTALNDMYAQGGINRPEPDIIPAGTVCRGIPYSGTADKSHNVGFNVSLLSFITAVHDPYSASYTEDVHKSQSVSAYGARYYGHNAHAALGNVCTSFLAYVCGRQMRWESFAFPYLESIGEVEKISDQSYKGVQLMDVIWHKGHVALVADIRRDGKGVPVDIVIAESRPVTGRFRHYSPADFTKRMEDNNETIYRFADGLESNTDYTPLPFAPLEGETAQAFEFNDDICTFMGDHATYLAGDLIVINYTRSDYSVMKIARDGTEVCSVELPERGDVHSVDIAPYAQGGDGRYAPGAYTAWLETRDGTGKSAPTHFLVADLPVSVARVSGDDVTVNFAGAAAGPDAEPSYVQVTNISGNEFCLIGLGGADKTAGSVTFNVREAIAAQAPTISLADDMYVAVVYKITDTYGFRLNRASEFTPLQWSFESGGAGEEQSEEFTFADDAQ